MLGGELEGDGAALRDAEDGGVGGELVLVLKFENEVVEEGNFAASEGGGVVGMAALAREVGHDAGEAGGGETLGDAEVVFFAPTEAMEEEDGAAELVGELGATGAKLFLEEGAGF